MKLALHVLTSAGFGKTYDFDIGATRVPENHELSYRDALAGILKDMLIAIIAANVKGPLWMLPKSWRNMKLCQSEFKQYMVEMAEEQRNAMKNDNQSSSQDNLMSALVRANEVSRGEGKERYSLTDDEIYGNLFIWNLAGHDTTATTLAYTFTLLSAHREVQDWISEEINAVLGDTSPDEWDYEATFPKLKRCLAVMVATPISQGVDDAN
jgi:cytochrome P450